eukprot:scpid50049/ scgid13206/ BTB/POZ domain-containing protein 19
MGTQDASSFNPGVVGLSRDLASLLDDRETGDVVFVLGSDMVHVHAHRLVLSARSEYYRQRKYDLWIKPYSPMAPLSIKRPQSTPAVFKNVLHFLYTGMITLSTESVFEILLTAEELGIAELLTMCERHLMENLTIENASRFLDSAIQMKASMKPERRNSAQKTAGQQAGANPPAPSDGRALIDRCLEFVEENAEQVVRTAGFLELSKKAIVHLVCSDQFALPEDEVWRCVLGWAMHQAEVTVPPKEWNEGQKKSVGEFLAGVVDHIKILLINSSVFAEEVEPTGAVPMQLSLERYRYAAVPAHFDPTTDTRLQARVSHRLFHSTQLLTQQRMRYQHLINDWCGCSGQQWQCLYRGTRDGFSAKSFHRKCDNKGPTLVLVKSTDNSLFGGYAEQSWTSQPSKGRFVKSTRSFLFTLQQSSGKGPMRYNVTKTNSALWHHPGRGPTFGSGFDLHIAANSQQSTTGYSSFPLSYGKVDSETALLSSLAGKTNFTVQEIEVFAAVLEETAPSQSETESTNTA